MPRSERLAFQRCAVARSTVTKRNNQLRKYLKLKSIQLCIYSGVCGWKGPNGQNGEVGWLPNEIELPASLKVPARNDLQ
jgi:hypothetical protein